MYALLLTLVSLLMATSCAPNRAARQQPMSQTFSEDGSGFFKVQGRIVSWGPKANRIPFAFDPHFPPELRVGCVNAVNTLNRTVGRELIRLLDDDLPFSENSDERNVISFGRSARPYPDNHAAETVIYFPPDHPRIIEADVDFDTRHFKFGVAGHLNEADVESTCLHELGHALGLTHVMNRFSMMSPRLILGVPRREPSPADVERLLTLYPPL